MSRCSNAYQQPLGQLCGRGSAVIEAFAVDEDQHRDGKIVTGDAGNYFTHLFAKPYDIGTVHAAGNSTLNVLKQLMVLVPGDKGELLPNPDSIVLERVNAGLGLV